MSTFTALKGFEDVTPIEQDEGPSPVAKIDYSNEFRILMDTFRGILHIGEKSRRVYNLTGNILDHNPANYTVWHYRRDVIREIMNNYIINKMVGRSIIDEELIFMDKFSNENPKNYQIWHHRRALIEIMNNYEKYQDTDNVNLIIKNELDFCEKVCDIDSKNYHAWAHRQWILKTYNYWDGEIQYVDKMLTNDYRNNSAWNQRWFVIHNSNSNIPFNEILENELKFTFNSIQTIKFNESSWNYLRGLANKYPEIKNYIKEFCSTLINDTEYNNHFAIALYADFKEQDNTKESLEESEQLYLHLSVIDPIRKKSWIRKVENVKQKCSLL